MSLTSPEPRPSPTVEDYLAIMYAMERDSGEIIAANLARSLEVTPPTVNATLKRMERDGWLTLEGRKGISLTQTGQAVACSVIRRHMLTEWLLARVLNVPWSRVHQEADQIEHSISDEIEERLRQELDDPLVCPHGNPLPGNEAVSAVWKPLTEAQAGDRITIRRIHETAEEDGELLQYLETNGVVPGAQAVVAEILPFNQTLGLDIENRKVILGFPAAQYIFVEKA